MVLRDGTNKTGICITRRDEFVKMHLPFRHNHLTLTLFIGLVIFVLTLLACVGLNPQWLFSGHDQIYARSEAKHKARNGTKIILFWTKRSGSRNWNTFPDTQSTRSLADVTRSCPQANCILTSNHSMVELADVLLFYLQEKPNWPKMRYAHQYYAHFIHEAPGKRNRHTFLDQYDGQINIAINYRRDADLYVPYNLLLPIPNDQHYKVRIPLRNKTKMAVWPVSHCSTESHREDYVKELSKYIDVDIYGKCGEHECPRSRHYSCLWEWERKYKFYISFENNICVDYMTEKVFQPLRYELIPVVLGGGNYSRDVPPNSVINARDFSSPKALAEFLIALSSDEERYQSYFRWKSRYKEGGGTMWWLCKLCEGLYEKRFEGRLARKHYADYWFGRREEMCDNDWVKRLRKAGGW